MPEVDRVDRVVAGVELLGRDDEQRRLGHLIGAARNGRGGSLLLVGEPGVGKTALLQDVVSDAVGIRTLQVDGYESESTIPYAAIHRLSIPLRHHLAALPVRQQEALQVAAGIAEGAPPDRFLVGLGLLGLLAASASDEPLVCLVDDAHLLDQESLEVLAFVARRIEVEPVGLLFAARDERNVTDRLGGVPPLHLAGLDTDAAISLLRRSLVEAIDPSAAVRIAGATAGNPLALVDLAVDLSSERLGAVALGDEPVPVGHRLEAHYVHRVREADLLVQEWVLVAAADTTGRIELVRSAAQLLGIAEDVEDRAEIAGLVELDDAVRFRHPLVRSAVYNATTGANRRRVHDALARAADDLDLVELEAWHASKATVGTDAAVADRLEHAADVAATRGGFSSRASVLARAAELTPPGPVQTARLVGAAEAALAVGAPQTATGYLELIDVATADPVVRGRIGTVRHALALFTVDAAALPWGAAHLVQAADDFRGLDPEREQQALLRAFEALSVADRRSVGITEGQLARRIEDGAQALDGPFATILRGLGSLMGTPYEQAVPLARAAQEAINKLPDQVAMSFGSASASIGTFLWDHAGRRESLDRAAAVARDAGALQDLDTLLWIISLSEVWGGTIRRARESVEQVREVRRAMGYDTENVINAAVMAWSGAPRDLVEAIGEGADALGFGGVTAATTGALAARDLAEGQYGDAYERLRPLVEQQFMHNGPSYFADFAEAAARVDRSASAIWAVEDLETRAALNGSAWCAGMAARARALVSRPKDAEPHFRSAVDLLADTTALVELGRAHLLYGEWLRRRRRRAEAARQLQDAHAALERAGADMFLPRVRAELEASGIGIRQEAHPPQHGLTHQELTVARLAGDGHTNSEIGALLFISPNTVDYHLRKVFQKLGISSRRQLADRLGALEP